MFEDTCFRRSYTGLIRSRPDRGDLVFNLEEICPPPLFLPQTEFTFCSSLFTSRFSTLTRSPPLVVPAFDRTPINAETL